MELSSQTTIELVKALVNAQKDMPGIKKLGTNPRFKNKYARYEDIRDACVETLAQNGLVITQHVWPEGDVQYLVTRLSHVSGEWMQSKCILPIQEFSSQNFGSAMTYCKRYTLESILMLAGDERDDDDGEKAEGRYETKITKVAPIEKKISAPKETRLPVLREMAAQRGLDTKRFDKYIEWVAGEKKVSVESYVENALIHPDITDQVIKAYAEALVKKPKVA